MMDGCSTVDEDLDNVYLSPDDLFSLFMEADHCEEILELFEDLLKSLNLNINNRTDIYRKLKSQLTSWKCQSLWDLIDTRAKQSEYGKGNFCKHISVLIIGSGPIGLRTAIEAALLGCRTVVVEKRTNFTRNNVLHLWPFLLTDFKGLGAKKFHGKFGAGSIDHISIRTLQFMLFKLCLLLGVEICMGVSFEGLIEPTEDKGWRANFLPENHPLLSHFEFDVVIGADGKKNVLPGFKQIEMRGALAIGITCNFVNSQTADEQQVQEISGIAYQFQPKFFDKMYEELSIKLENIVYYKDETHYFVMTATKSSLKERGVLKQDCADPSKLLAKSNIDLDNLIKFATDAVNYSTQYQLPSHALVLETNSHGNPDVAVFDFTSIKKASNASRIIERKGKRLLTALVGDSLLEPFWPTGSGCGRGVLSALDTAWMIRQYALKFPPLFVLRERENIFKLLSGTNPESLQKNYKAYTIDPFTRYSNLNPILSTNVALLKGLYDTDDPENADYSIPEPTPKLEFTRTVSTLPKHRKKSAGKGRRSHSTMSHKRRSDRTTLKEAKHVSKARHTWEEKTSTSTTGYAAKRTKPSGSGSSGLESVSESEKEEDEERRKKYERMESGGSLAEVFTSSNESVDKLLSNEDEEMPPPRTIAVPKSRFRTASKNNNKKGSKVVKDVHEEKSSHVSSEHKKEPGSPSKTSRGGVMSFLFSGRGKKESEADSKKATLAARKSIGRARRNRLSRHRRKSGSKSADEKEHHPSSGKSARRSSPSKDKFRKPVDKQLSTSKKNDSEGIPVSRSAKDLIAEMEAREKDKKSSYVKNGSVKSTTAQSSAAGSSVRSVNSSGSGLPVKRKAGEFAVPEPKAPKETTNSEEFPSLEPYIPLLDILKPTSSIPNGYQPEFAARNAALVLLALPLLLPCKRPVNWFERRAPERSSMEKRETRKISAQRAGSVLRAVQEYKTKLSQEQTDRRNSYYDFKERKPQEQAEKRNSHIEKKPGEDTGEGDALLANSIDRENGYDVIEMKKGDFQPKESPSVGSQSEVNKMEKIYGIKSVKRDHNDMKDKSQKRMSKREKKPRQQVLQEILDELQGNNSLRRARITLLILISIHRNIVKHINIDKYYRVYCNGADFNTFVWKSKESKKFLEEIGWCKSGSFLILSKSKVVNEPLKCLENALRSIDKSLQQRTSLDTRAGVSRSSSPGKQELFELIDNLDETNLDSDSDQDTFQSSEELIGDEEYLVVSLNRKESKSTRKMSENVPTEPECAQEEVVIETKITGAAAEPFNFVEPEKPNRRNGNKIRNEESNRNKPEETKLGKAKKKKYVLKRKKPKSSSQSDSDASVKSEGSVKGRVKADSKVSVEADVTAEEVKPHEVADDASKEIKTPYKSCNIGNNLDKSPSEVEYPSGDKSILAESAPKIESPTESKLVSPKGTDESENRQEDESINAPVADNASLNVEPQSSKIATVTTEVSDEYAVSSEEKLSTEKPKEEKLSLNVNITLKVNNETVEENDATIKENKESVKENKESVKETNGIVKETNGIVKEHNEAIKENGDQPKVQTLCVEHEDVKPKKKKKKKFVLRRKSNRKNSQQETVTPKEVLAALEAENKESHAENSKSEGLPTIDKEETKPSNGEIEPRNGGTVFQENNGSAKNDSKSVSEPQMIDSSRDLDTETRGNHVTSENTKEEPEKLAGHGNVSETDAHGISDENTETTLETHSKEKKKSKKLKFFSLKSKKRGNGKDKDRDSKLSDAKTTDSLTYSNGVTDNLSVSSELSYDSKRLSQSSQALNEEGENVDIRGSTSSLYVPGEKKKKRFILKRKKKSSKDQPQSDEGKNQGVITNGNTESKEKNQHYLLI